MEDDKKLNEKLIKIRDGEKRRDEKKIRKLSSYVYYYKIIGLILKENEVDPLIKERLDLGIAKFLYDANLALSYEYVLKQKAPDMKGKNENSITIRDRFVIHSTKKNFANIKKEYDLKNEKLLSNITLDSKLVPIYRYLDEEVEMIKAYIDSRITRKDEEEMNRKYADASTYEIVAKCKEMLLEKIDDLFMAQNKYNEQIKNYNGRIKRAATFSKKVNK